jgi:hypothetical protein
MINDTLLSAMTVEKTIKGAKRGGTPIPRKSPPFPRKDMNILPFYYPMA